MENKEFSQQKGLCYLVTLIVPPTSCQVSEKSLELVLRSIRDGQPKHLDKGDSIEPVSPLLVQKAPERPCPGVRMRLHDVHLQA